MGSTPFLQGAALMVFQDTLGQAFLYKQKHFPQGLTFSPATSSGATFTSDPKYLLDATIEYSNALPVNQKGIDLLTKIDTLFHWYWHALGFFCELQSRVGYL
jgi:hypothetical protein